MISPKSIFSFLILVTILFFSNSQNSFSQLKNNSKNIFKAGSNSDFSGTPITWIGGDGNWSDITKWSQGYVPTSTDDVLISPSSPVTITITANSNYTVNSLTMGNNNNLDIDSSTLLINTDLLLNNGLLDINESVLNVKGNMICDTGIVKSDDGSIIFSGTTSSQLINFGEFGTVFYNITFTGGGAAHPKILVPGCSCANMVILNDFTVESSAQLSLSAHTKCTYDLQGNLFYSGIPGGANMDSLYIVMLGDDKTIGGASAFNRSVSNHKKTAPVITKYTFIQDKESDNAKSVLNISGFQKNAGEKIYTKQSMKETTARILAGQKPNEKIVIVLEDATLIKNPSENDYVPTGQMDFSLEIEANSIYTLTDDISLGSGSVLNMYGRLNCGTHTVGGSGNIFVQGIGEDNTNGIIGTASTSDEGFTNFTTSGIQDYYTGNDRVSIIDYNASGDQKINVLNQPDNTFIMCSTGGTKTLSKDYIMSGTSSTGLAGATASASKGALTVKAGVTFADSGNVIVFGSVDNPINIIIEGNFVSIDNGGIYWTQSRFSTVFVKEGTAFGNLGISSFQGNPGYFRALSGSDLNISARSMSFGGASPSYWQISKNSNTTLIITGDISLEPNVAADAGGGFTGNTAKTTTVKVGGNIISTSTNTTQNILEGAGTNVLEMNGTAVQQMSFPTSLTSLTFLPGVTLRVNNSHGVTLTNASASTCTFTLGSGGGVSILAGSLALGQADIFGYDAANSFLTFADGVIINSSEWPSVNGPFNVNINGSCIFSGDKTIAGTLSLNAGILNTSSSVLTIGTSTSNLGSISYTSGSVKGSLKRWFNTSGTNNTLFPMDDNNGQYVPVQLSFTDAPSTGGTLTASFKSTGSGTNGLPISNGPGGADIVNSAPGFWTMAAGDGLSGYTYDISCTGTNFGGVSNLTTLVLLKRDNSASAWTWSSGVHQTTTGTLSAPVAHGTGFSLFSDFTVGGESDNPLPVELSSFISNVYVRDVKLNWSTKYENNNARFEIERTIIKEIAEWKKIGNVNGAGTTGESHSYNFEDKKLESGKYSYRLKQIDYNGNYKYYDLSNEVIIGVPDKFSVSQNYPNPFNPATKIDFTLPFDSRVSIKLFDMRGGEVSVIVNEGMTAGYYTTQFNGANLSSGIYFYRIIAEGGNNRFTSTKKMILVK